MEQYFNASEIRTLIQETCDKAGKSEIGPYISFEFSGRLKTTFGKAWTLRDINGGKISFSSVLWGRAKLLERKDTIIHETCHILANLISKSNCGHNHFWKTLMRVCGASNVSRCHKVSTEGLTRTQKRFSFSCRQCDKSIKVSANLRTRIINSVGRNKYYVCRRCKSKISLDVVLQAKEDKS